jgi:hypothetical protein
MQSIARLAKANPYHDAEGKLTLKYNYVEAGYGDAVSDIEAALSAGQQVAIVYTYRDPIDALVNGALARASRLESSGETGRVVPINRHLLSHWGSLETLKKVSERYAANPNVQIRVVNNSYGYGKAKEVPVASLPSLNYTDTERKLYEALETEFKAGRISYQVSEILTRRGLCKSAAP